MFCPECGKKCDDGMLFCWNCGTKLPVEHPSAPLSSPSVASASGGVDLGKREEPSVLGTNKSDSGLFEGVIFTNLQVLATKLETDAGTLRKLFEEYIGIALRAGIQYHLIDVSDYHLLNPEVNKKRRITSLSPSDSWVEHNYVLADYYRFGRNTSEDVANYLFIIGGNDVIPMPEVTHYIKDSDWSETTIDTDIPYAYILGEKTYPKLENAKIFEYEQYFYVGRLPMAAEASLDDLIAYLYRASQSFDEVSIERGFGLTDLTWLSASECVRTPFSRYNLYQGDDRLDDRIYTHNLYISPHVTSDLVDRVFDRQADLFYFNLHGSDAPTSNGFYTGYQNVWYEAILPHQLASAEKPNMVVTEACYGAKFQDYNRGETMLLAAMGNNTLVYLGSSRTAWGACECSSETKLDNADRITNAYMTKLLEGYSAGEALFLARQSFFEMGDSNFPPVRSATIVEFNLFGDPFIYCGSRSAAGKTVAPQEVKALTTEPINTVVESKNVYSAKPQSLLETVRGAVDRNLAMIRSTVDRELYQRLGVEPRQLSGVFRQRYGNGDEFYVFNYVDDDNRFKRQYSATTDLKGKIMSIITTK
jgi:hypothetical protein